MSPPCRKIGELNQADLPSVDPRSWRPEEIRGSEPQTGTRGRQVFVEITGGIIWNGINLLYLLHGAEVAMKSQPGVHMHIPSHRHRHLPRACTHNPVHTDTHRQTITATVLEPQCFLSLYGLSNRILEA